MKMMVMDGNFRDFNSRITFLDRMKNIETYEIVIKKSSSNALMSIIYWVRTLIIFQNFDQNIECNEIH